MAGLVGARSGKRGWRGPQNCTIPATNSWSSADSMAGAQECHTATLLSSGKVLVAGGFNSNYGPLSSTELYDQPPLRLVGEVGLLIAPALLGFALGQ